VCTRPVVQLEPRRQDAARKIGVGNSMAEEGKSVICSEKDLAAAAAYKTPSPLGLALQGVGGILGSLLGPNEAQLPFGAGRRRLTAVRARRIVLFSAAGVRNRSHPHEVHAVAVPCLSYVIPAGSGGSMPARIV
jgi:hypothetical protein